MISINMLSRAESVQGQGVGSAYREQMELCKKRLSPPFRFLENSLTHCPVVHYHTINPEFYLNRLIKDRKSFSIASVHFLPETLKNSLQLPPVIEKRFYSYLLSFYRMMDVLVVVNPSFTNALVQYGIPRKKIIYIPNYVSDEVFFPETDDKKLSAWRKEFQIDPDRFNVLAVGQLQTRKGVLDFLELAERMPEINFIWAGGFSFGVITDGYLELKERTENPPSNVRFLGIIRRERMNALYNVCDILFQPSFEELFPMTILEAMSVNKPLLLRDLEEYKVILDGYYCKGIDVTSFQQQIQHLSSKGAYYAEASELSKRGSLLYGPDRIAKNWKDLYRYAAQKSQLRK